MFVSFTAFWIQCVVGDAAAAVVSDADGVGDDSINYNDDNSGGSGRSIHEMLTLF